MKIKEVESKWKLLCGGSETFCQTALPLAPCSPVSACPGHRCQTRSRQVQALLSPSAVGIVGRVLGNSLGKPEAKGVRVLLRTV